MVYMNEIKKIDSELSDVLAGLDKTLETLDFELIGDLRNEELIKNHQYSGIYLIEIECTNSDMPFLTWFEEFKTKWEKEAYKKKWTPSIKKKRVKAHNELKRWMPIYIGKSRDISGRLLGHLNLRLDQPTTGLKLNARTNMDTENFRVSTIKVEVDNYDIILPIVERTLRDKINPLVGRQ